MKIETERLILREFTEDDYILLHEIFADPWTMRFYPAPFNEQKTRKWIEWNLNNYKKYGFGLWAVVDKKTDRLIGDCSLTMQNIDGNILPEIGYHIHKEFQGKGLAKEAAIAVRDWAFLQTDFDCLYSYMKSDDTAFCTVAIGMGENKRTFRQQQSNPSVLMISRRTWYTLCKMIEYLKNYKMKSILHF